jgi:hypothetical protein
MTEIENEVEDCNPETFNMENVRFNKNPRCDIKYKIIIMEGEVLKVSADNHEAVVV